MPDAKLDLETPRIENLSPHDAFAVLVEHVSHLEASDLFLETDREQVSVSMRHLGVVRPLTTASPDKGAHLIRHVKAEAGLDIADSRHPQDGRWLFQRLDGHTLDLRLATLPTLFGEDLSVRLLDREIRLYDLASLGLETHQRQNLEAMLQRPSGLVLVSGPTGVGKSTTLYACLEYLNNGSRKIHTIEDPVEYHLPGVRQSQVNPHFHVDFPELLAGILRQSPDVIMIGEIRDQITAETAIRAAHSGHLVFATLHAPVAAAAIETLLDFGVHPHFLATSLLGVISRRLVRTLDADTKVEVDLGDHDEAFTELHPWLKREPQSRIYAAQRNARYEGYAGRTGVFEMLTPTPAMRKLIAQQAPARQLHEQALEQGMLDLRRAALIKVARGRTSVEEVTKVVPTELLLTEPDDGP